jgi:chemotaxis protein MotB
MRIVACRLGGVLLVLLGTAVGCSQNSKFANPFSMSARGAAGRVPSGSPAQQVAQLEKWRRQSEDDANQMRTRVAQLTDNNRSLQTQIVNVKRHAQLQDQHLKSVSDRLKATTTELAQTQAVKRDTSQNAASLDQLNQEKERQLAAARQSVQRLQENLQKSNEQLHSSQADLVRSKSEKAAAQQSVQHLTSASRQRGGATISANSNLPMADIHAEGVTLQRDGEVIRVRFASGVLFAEHAAQLGPKASALLDRVALQLAKTYPEQRLGVEGHASVETKSSSAWRNAHHLSSARAMAVYEFILSRSLFRTEQMFIVGHGSNHPVYSTATESGRRANNRVELVIYPETISKASR